MVFDNGHDRILALYNYFHKLGFLRHIIQLKINTRYSTPLDDGFGHIEVKQLF